MSDENFWPCLEDMVKILSGTREDSEATLDRLESELRALPKSKREELRHDMMIVVGQVARLATRINDMVC
jgi:hypothetical protein